MSAYIKCSVLGCNNQHKSLHRLPTSVDRRAEWIKFIFDGNLPAHVPKRLLVCAHHFLPACFVNLGQYNAGFASHLNLDDKAIPTVRGNHAGSAKSSVLSKQRRPNVGCQTDPPQTHTVGTQLSLRTLQPHVRSRAVQATVSYKDLDVGTSTVPVATPLPFLISKRPRLDVEEEQDSFDGSSSIIQRAASLQNHDPASETSHGDPPLMKKETPDLALHNVRVNTACLLQFQQCGQCNGQCVVRQQGETRHFTVIQHCQVCNQRTTWTSQPFKDAEESIALSGGVREGDQESTASTMMMTMGQADGVPSRRASLPTEDEKKGTAQESEKKLHQFAEVELTINFSEESETHLAERDGAVGEGEAGVENTNMDEEEEEAENTEESETEEEDEEDDDWEMDDDEEESEEEEEMGKVRKVRKRLRNDRPDPLGHWRRKGVVKRDQKRPETLCTDCGHLYKTLSHKCDPQKFQCTDCGVCCLSELSLSVHINGHCSRHCQACVFCHEPFKTRQERLTHEMSHSGEKPYECPECPQRFPDRFSRGHHLKEHPKRCRTCQKEFPDLFALQRHEMSHSSDKPFKCEVCDREFVQASQLKSHLRVHTGEKPFQCRLCPKSFNHNISLKNHTRRYHQGESPDHPALREQGEGHHGPKPDAGNGAEQREGGGTPQ